MTRNLQAEDYPFQVSTNFGTGSNASSITCITILIGKYRVEIPSQFDKETLRAILQSIPC